MWFLVLTGSALTPVQGGGLDTLEIRRPKVVLRGIPFSLEVVPQTVDGNTLTQLPSEAPVLEGLSLPPSATVTWDVDRWRIQGVVAEDSGLRDLVVHCGEVESRARVRVIPGWLSVLPPLVAIALALILRQVVISLISGIWLGAIFLFDYDVGGGFFRVLDYFVVNALSDRSHAQIILFSLLFGGMVGVITANGGAQGIARLITRYARTPRGGQVATWGLAFVLFFDDYANVLVRGNLMRPITDRLRISREKLAFYVDTGAATVASVMVISTWIGYELGLIEQGLRIIGSDENAYTVFLSTIPFRFYPIFALWFALLIAWTGRDFGPMWEAERRARLEGKLLRDGAEPATDLTASAPSAGKGREMPSRWINGLLPIATILVVGLAGLWVTGRAALQEQGVEGTVGIGEVVRNSDSYVALLWASFAGCVVAVVLSVVQRILTLAEALDAWVAGLKSMTLAMLILLLAWSLGAVTEEVHTADYLVQLLRGVLSPYWLPVLTFVTAAVVSFSTGTSWATMAILMPLVIPLGHTLAMDAGLSADVASHLLVGVISSVLAGAVFGDHCSPISDTTVLSSMASACDHIDHVWTQLPYALSAALVGMLVGDIPTAYGFPVWLSLPLGAVVIWLVVRLLGRPVPSPVSQA